MSRKPSLFWTLTKFHAKYSPESYPGSPLSAVEILRITDSLQLAELHRQKCAAPILAITPYHAGYSAQVSCALTRLFCPPLSRRGMLLLDASYAVKSEYGALLGFIRHIHGKRPLGIIVLWYPLLRLALHHSM